jgi:hypothetical protein
MRDKRLMAMACAVLIGTIPAAAAAQANHNTARSNKSTVAAPAEETSPAGNSEAQQTSGKKGYDYYKSQSDMAAGVTGPTDTGQNVEGAGKDAAVAPGANSDEAAQANINTSRSNSKGQ